MRRLFTSALVTLGLLVSHEVYAVPVNPDPLPSATFSGTVNAVAYWDNVLYVGGEFTRATTLSGSSVRRTRLAAVDAVTGALLDWAPAADGPITDMAADSSGVYIIGSFQSVNLQSRDNLAKLDLRSGAVLPAFKHRISGRVNKISAGNGRIYIGGAITAINDVPRWNTAAFDASTGALDQTWAPILTDELYSLLAARDRVYLGGRFDDVNGAPKTQKLAAVHPATGRVDPSFESRVHVVINALQLQDDTLYVGISGDGGRAAAMDLSGNPKWVFTFDGDVQAIAVLDGVVYLGGHFDRACKTDRLTSLPGLPGAHCADGFDTRVKLAALSGNGELLPWTADGSGTIGVKALVANPRLRQVVAGGSFRYIGGLDQRRFALFTLPL